jgi:hypothetical protein
MDELLAAAPTIQAVFVFLTSEVWFSVVQTYRAAYTLETDFLCALCILCCTPKGIRDVWSVEFKKDCS